MNILSELKEDIKAVDVQIDKLTNQLAKVHEEDVKSQKELRSQLNQFNVTKTAKQRLYHEIKQDIELRNDEIRARISKLEGTGSEVEDMSEIYDEIYNNE